MTFEVTAPWVREGLAQVGMQGSQWEPEGGGPRLWAISAAARGRRAHSSTEAWDLEMLRTGPGLGRHPSVAVLFNPRTLFLSLNLTSVPRK